LLVTIDTLFKMMEDGLYPLSKLQVILLHLLQIKSDAGEEEAEDQDADDDTQDDPYHIDETAQTKNSNEELVLDSLIRFWNKALASWVPS